MKEKKYCFACFEILRVVKVKFIYCSKMYNFEYLPETSLSSYGGGSSGNEADSEGEQVCEKDVKEITDMMKCFTPDMFEPEKDDVSSISSSESKTNLEKSSRVGNLEWCKCGECNIEKREIDCLCCQEVDALNSKFDRENMSCVIKSIEFETLCINKLVLENVLTGLHESRGDHMEKTWSNRSLRYAAYKQFIWWVFKSVGKGNRRVIPSCALWRIRKLYPEPNREYTLYSEGRRD